MFRWSLVFIAIIVFTLITPCVFAEGVTIIVHGFNSDAETYGWVSQMQEAIWFRFPPSDDITVYPVEVIDAFGSNVVMLGERSGTAPLDSNSGEIVLLLDWSTADGLLDTNTSVIDALVPELLNSSFIPELGKPLAQLPFHLIGHSRGGSLVCGLAKALGEKGISVDHVTTLDPHPYGSDAPAEVYSNVLFADNYFEEADTPHGEFIAGVYNRDLGILAGGYYDVIPQVSPNHSNTHLWYHGTIDLDTPITVDYATINSTSRSEWWFSGEQSGAKAGYYYSRVVGGNRLDHPIITGLSYEYGGYGERVPVDLSNASWPSIYTFNIERDGRTIKNDESVGIGESLDLKVTFQDPNSNFTVYYYLDADRNPYKNNNILAIGNKPAFPQSTTSDIYTWNTSSVNAGTSGYVCAEINNGTHKRFFYSPMKLTFYEPVNTAYTYSGTFLCKGVTQDGVVEPKTTFIYPDDFPSIYLVVELREVRWCDLGGGGRENSSVNLKLFNPGGALVASDTWLIQDTFPTWYYYPIRFFGWNLTGSGIEDYPGKWNYQATIGGTFCDTGIFDNGYFYILPHPPAKATSPTPDNEASNLPLDTTVRWSPAARADSYLVYFGTDPTPNTTEYRGEFGDISYDPGLLEGGTTYYWRIDTKSVSGTTIGDVWSFSTVVPQVDLTSEGIVNLADYAIFSNQWLNTPCTEPNWCSGADINHSGTVSIDDLLIMVDNWLLRELIVELKNDEFTGSWDSTHTIDVLSNDEDVQGNPLIDCSISSYTFPENGGSLSLNPDNSFSYTPPIDAAFVWDGTSSYAVFTDTFTYKVVDSQGTESLASGTVTVNVTNYLPVLESVDGQIHMNEPFDFDSATKVTDIDGSPNPLEVGVNNPTWGNTSVNENHVIYQPFDGFVGMDDFEYTVSDASIVTNGNVPVVLNEMVLVMMTNELPIVVGGDIGDTQVDTVLTIAQIGVTSPVSVIDFDGDPLSIIQGTYFGSGAGSLTFDGSNWNYTPTPGFIGQELFEIKAWDGQYIYYSADTREPVYVNGLVSVDVNDDIPTP